ncbi:hypothetical protein ACEWY4_010686 [Coilia grayii]|uniref:CARD domain-containing protein n=1 Tax=Coilia grayii TaxID=363190 RepID=A0ABD1K2L2_9TELE
MVKQVSLLTPSTNPTRFRHPARVHIGPAHFKQPTLGISPASRLCPLPLCTQELFRDQRDSCPKHGPHPSLRMLLPLLQPWVHAGGVEDVWGVLLRGRMFGSGTRKWLVRTQRKQRGGAGGGGRKRKRRAARVLRRHRGLLLGHLDVARVLPPLVRVQVFSPAEQQEVLGQGSPRQRAARFLELLGAKGPEGLYAFCSVLEHTCPRLLTCLLLEEQDESLGQQGKQGPPVPPCNHGDDPLRDPEGMCLPPMYTDPLYDTR